MDLRHVIGIVALASLTLGGACECPDEEVEQRLSVWRLDALDQLASAAESSAFCLDACSVGVVEAPEGDIESCLVDVETEELECVINTGLNVRQIRIPAERIWTEDLMWPEALESALTEAYLIRFPSDEDAECVVELGERITDQMSVCMGPPDCVGGRLARSQLGLDLQPPGSARSRWWAQMAALEWAAVRAFGELADDLCRLGAPRTLVDRALDAQEDERVHARLCASMAGLCEGWNAAPGAQHPRRRVSILEFARVNASEGCIRESFAALEALVQSHRAADPKERAVLRRIANDEVRHGQLSWDIDAWAAQRLSNRGKHRVRRSRRAAVRRTWTSLSREPSLVQASDSAPGLPDARGRQRLFRRFLHELARSPDSSAA